MSDQNNNQQQNQFQQVPQPPYTVPQEKPKKPVYKKWWFWVIIVIVAIVIFSSIGGGSSDTSTTESNQTTANSVAAQDDEKEKDVIGDYKCVVKKATLCKDYEGKDAVKIVYEFTNNSDEAVSFDIALQDDVYQDGVGLETAILSGDDIDYGVDVKIKPGVSKEVTKAYVLSDTSTDLTVEIGELISFDDSKITTTVKITK